MELLGNHDSITYLQWQTQKFSFGGLQCCDVPKQYYAQDLISDISDKACTYGTKTRLKPLYVQLQVLNIDEVYKLKVAKFMAKVSLNKLPVFCGNQLTIFRTLPSIHTYSTQIASSTNFYVQKTLLIKTNQSLKISGVKIWNSFPRHITDKVLTFRDKTSSKIIKNFTF